MHSSAGPAATHAGSRAAYVEGPASSATPARHRQAQSSGLLSTPAHLLCGSATATSGAICDGLLHRGEGARLPTVWSYSAYSCDRFSPVVGPSRRDNGPLLSWVLRLSAPHRASLANGPSPALSRDAPYIQCGGHSGASALPIYALLLPTVMSASAYRSDIAAPPATALSPASDYAGPSLSGLLDDTGAYSCGGADAPSRNRNAGPDYALLYSCGGASANACGSLIVRSMLLSSIGCDGAVARAP
jgi:hypothetical protein